MTASEFSLSSFTWALSIVWGHTLVLPKNREHASREDNDSSNIEPVLVPKVSSLSPCKNDGNKIADCENRFEINAEEGMFKMVATKSYRVHEPV